MPLNKTTLLTVFGQKANVEYRSCCAKEAGYPTVSELCAAWTRSWNMLEVLIQSTLMGSM